MGGRVPDDASTALKDNASSLKDTVTSQWSECSTSVKYGVYAVGALCGGEILHRIAAKFLPGNRWAHSLNPWCWIRSKVPGLKTCTSKGSKNDESSSEEVDYEEELVLIMPGR